MVLKNLQRQQSRGPGIYIYRFLKVVVLSYVSGAPPRESCPILGFRRVLATGPIFIGVACFGSFVPGFVFNFQFRPEFFGFVRFGPKLPQTQPRAVENSAAKKREQPRMVYCPKNPTRANPNQPERTRTSPNEPEANPKEPKEPQRARSFPKRAHPGAAKTGSRNDSALSASIVHTYRTPLSNPNLGCDPILG